MRPAVTCPACRTRRRASWVGDELEIGRHRPPPALVVPDAAGRVAPCTGSGRRVAA